MNKKYITTREATERYGFSRTWFSVRRQRGYQPKFIRVNTKVLYPLEDTDKYFELFFCNDGKEGEIEEKDKKE